MCLFFLIYFFLLRGCLWMNASEGNNHDDDNEHDSLDAKLNYYLWNICLSWFSSNCIFFNFPPRNRITIDWLKMKIYYTLFLLERMLYLKIEFENIFCNENNLYIKNHFLMRIFITFWDTYSTKVSWHMEILYMWSICNPTLKITRLDFVRLELQIRLGNKCSCNTLIVILRNKTAFPNNMFLSNMNSF